ncbi:YicC/YloC family endoribonuclease [Adhaeribacter rhizoryzae]|uniref:YicC family protein n=1 Tax=Adhaeribacter rhizoryzae TaxID=2607907 RepID=A0A5M6DMR1_9BACT|nr:YicC/YloC family endoribonuclease [Adhaeribacter rhizoryzae]KAA5547529.1 YicC family protein [Adhaeribacter rhizoryzae]
MLQSMTGFGTARQDGDQYSITIDIRSLNSKGLDLSLRLPRFLADKEHEIRTILGKSLVRGKVSLSVDYSGTTKAARTANSINQELLQHYYTELENAADLVGASKNDLFRLALQMPEVIQQAPRTEEEDAQMPVPWEIITELLQEAIANLNRFRSDEGKALTSEIMAYVDRIRILLAEVDKYDPVRLEYIRERIRTHLAEISNSEQFNQNRFEQEMIYFIEKLDIAEEKVRLINHLHYFTETVYLPEPTGKKLAFISQEIGREINTIGSKANDATIQHLVVEMKEELEKIKEQLNNIL